MRPLLILMATFFPLAEYQARIHFDFETDRFSSEGGIVMERLVFKDDEGFITFTPPAGWRRQGQANIAIFSREDAVGGRLEISAIEGSKWPELTLEPYVNIVRSELPQGAELVEVISATDDCIVINGTKTFEVTVSFRTGKALFQRSVLFYNRAKDQIRFAVTARATSFREVHEQARQSWYSWQHVKTLEETR